MTDPKLSRPAAAASLHPPSLTIRRKRAEDTPAGCRELAAADLRRADDLAADHIRWRYRRSADAWLARADFLDRLEANFQQRVSRAVR